MSGDRQTHETLSFGTDGWRDVIDEGFNIVNVKNITQAICDYIVCSSELGVQGQHRTPNTEHQALVVGYDTRRYSEEYAKEVALVTAGNGIKAYLSDSYIPTPVTSLSTVLKKASGAVMLTASHNPPNYNGLKFKTHRGGSASPKTTRAIEEIFEKNISQQKQPAKLSEEEARDKDLLVYFNAKEDYLSSILRLINKKAFAKSQIKVVVDPMYGTTSGYLSEALRGLGCEVKEIHSQADSFFGGINPEPIPPHIEDLQREVVESKFDLGIALDGDGDRIGAVDAKGTFVNSHQIFALLLDHLAGRLGEQGKVIKTVSVTQLVDLLAQKYKLPLYEVPIGFKHIAEHFLAGGVLIGGEESGGIGIRGNIPERDGVFIGLVLVEIMATCDKSLRFLIEDLFKRFGFFYYDRFDLEVDLSTKERITSFLSQLKLGEVANRKVIKVNDLDGYKFLLDDSSWLMLRPSGTERVVRIYAEGHSPEEISVLIEEGKRIIGQAKES